MVIEEPHITRALTQTGAEKTRLLVKLGVSFKAARLLSTKISLAFKQSWWNGEIL